MSNLLHASLLLMSVGVAAYLLTGRLVQYALKRELLDLPNARSSHTLPTPRGGGLAIVVTFFTGLIYITLIQKIALHFSVALLGSGLMVALVGWLDDRSHVPVRVRLLVQFVAAAWGLFWLGAFNLVDPAPDLWRWFFYVIVFLCVVWLLNLYNFMDGINGIAGIEAITVCAGAVVLVATAVGFGSLTLTPLLLLFSVTGFLVWNFPIAKIFMGDVGSGFIGLMLALIAIEMALANTLLLWGWVILLGVFIVDASLTLMRRILRRQRFYEAHCSHAYQHAARRYGHTLVATTCGLINLLWLLPIALCVVLGVITPAVGILLAFLPLGIGAIYFKAGLDANPG